MQKRWIGVLAIIILGIALFAGLRSSRSRLVFYPERDWDPVFLDMLRQAPQFLSADLPIDIRTAPLSNSTTTQAEIAYLLDLQGKRSAADLAAIEREANNPMPLFLTEFGFDPVKMPKTMTLINATAAEAGHFIMREKHAYQRARASQVDLRISPAIPVPHHAAYPSGHAGQTHATALALAQVSPSRAAAWLQFADKVAYDRELAGLHYPSDSVAGKQLADQVVTELLKNDQYLALVRDAQQEWIDRQKAP